MSANNSDHSKVIDRLADIFERRGAESYLGEAVTMAEHMYQTAALALAEGAPDALVAAALLHDIGHYTSEFGEYCAADVVDKQHDAAGGQGAGRRLPACGGRVRTAACGGQALPLRHGPWLLRRAFASLQAQSGPPGRPNECGGSGGLPRHVLPPRRRAGAPMGRRWQDRRRGALKVRRLPPPAAKGSERRSPLCRGRSASLRRDGPLGLRPAESPRLDVPTPEQLRHFGY